MGQDLVSVKHWPGAGPQLVALHGAGGCAASWEPLVAELTDYSLWMPDLPGRDGSPGPACQTAEGAAAWLDELLDALGLDAPLVLGHSYGGGVALELCRRRGSQRMLGLVLVCSGARLRVAPPLLAAAAAATEEYPLAIDFAFAAGTPTENIATYDEVCSRVPPAATLADWQACDGFDALGMLEGLDLPVLVVHGSDDLLTPPRFQRYLEDHLPFVYRVEIEEAGHMLPWERPAALAAAIRGWATQIGLGY